MIKNSKVSIIIPVYNGANFLAQAIDSVLRQTYQNIEIIVVNDGSKDYGATERIAQSYGRKIRYFSKSNGGVSSALNFGIKKMTGDYFSWLSHDDIYLPGRVQTQIDFLKNQPPNTILYSDFEFIDSDNRHLATINIVPPRDDQFVYTLIMRRFLHGCTVMIPKEAFQKTGEFNENLKNCQDYEMWLRMSKQGFIFHHLNQVLVQGRIHPNQGGNLRKEIQFKDEEQVYQWVLANFSPEEIFGKVKDKAQYYFNLALGCKKAGLPKTGELARKLGRKNLSYQNYFPNWLYYFYCNWWDKKR